MIRKKTINFSKKKAEINLEIKKEYLPLHSLNGTRVVKEREAVLKGKKRCLTILKDKYNLNSTNKSKALIS